MPLSYRDLESVRAAWPEVLAGLEIAFLKEQRWFQGRWASSLTLDAADYVFLPWSDPDEFVSLNIVRALVDGMEQSYFIPLIILPERPGLPVMARLTVTDRPYVAAEASLSRRVATALLDELAAGRTHQGVHGEFAFHPASPGFVRAVRPLNSDSTNTVLHLHRDEVQKITRRLWPGVSREVELGLILKGQQFIPSIHGHLTYTLKDGPHFSLALWQEFLPNRGNLWDAMAAGLAETMRLAVAPGQPVDSGELLTEWLKGVAGDLENLAVLLADLHLALTAAEQPVPFTEADLQPILARIRTYLEIISQGLTADPPELWTQASDLVGHLAAKLAGAGHLGQKIQIHGDFHLGQILLAEGGYVVLDLEGEPLHEPGSRIALTTPLRDLAGAVRSFSYVGQAAYLALLAGQRVLPEQQETALFLAQRFADRASAPLVRSYGALISRQLPGFVPGDPVAFVDLLDLCQLEKVLYELQYELINRPEWVSIPLHGLKALLLRRLGVGVRA